MAEVKTSTSFHNLVPATAFRYRSCLQRGALKLLERGMENLVGVLGNIINGLGVVVATSSDSYPI
jgi:hypothetical protein